MRATSASESSTGSVRLTRTGSPRRQPKQLDELVAELVEVLLQTDDVDPCRFALARSSRSGVNVDPGQGTFGHLRPA